MLVLLAILVSASTACEETVARMDEALAARDRCATTALMIGLETALAQGDAACFDQAMRQRGLPAAAVMRSRPERPRPPEGEIEEKIVRDAREEPYPYLIETEHFALKWGSYEGFSGEDADALAVAMEHAWEVEVETWGFRPPEADQPYKFNVYIGDTENTASSMGAAGYYYYDADGVPMIVIAASLLTDHAYAASTVAHEFFHALQGEIGSYQYRGQGAWYTEATAVWAEEQVYPEYVGASGFVVAFAYLPEYSLNFFDYPDEGTLAELYQYGAFIFPRFLSDRYGGEFIQRTWTEAPRGGDPLLVIGELLAEEGENIEDTFFDFAAHNATWDYPLGQNYRYWIDAWGGLNGRGSHAPSGRFSGTDGWRRPDYAPHTYGSNYWQITKPFVQTGLEFAADDPTVEWSVFLVERTGDTHVRTEIPVVDGAITVDLGDLSGRDELWLAVSVVDGPVDRGTVYDYQVRLTELYVAPAPEITPEEPKGGCNSAALYGPWALALLALRRRYRTKIAV